MTIALCLTLLVRNTDRLLPDVILSVRYAESIVYSKRLKTLPIMFFSPSPFSLSHYCNLLTVLTLIRQEDDNEMPVSVMAERTDTRARDLITVISTVILVVIFERTTVIKSPQIDVDKQPLSKRALRKLSSLHRVPLKRRVTSAKCRQRLQMIDRVIFLLQEVKKSEK